MYYALVVPDVPAPSRANRYLYFIRVQRFMEEAYDDAFDYDWTRAGLNLLANRTAQFQRHVFPLSVIGAGGWELANWMQDYEPTGAARPTPPSRPATTLPSRTQSATQPTRAASASTSEGSRSSTRLPTSNSTATWPWTSIVDGGFGVLVDGVQRWLIGSGRAPRDRPETSLGPITIEIVEPTRVAPVIVDALDQGLSADLVFTTGSPVAEEERMCATSVPARSSTSPGRPQGPGHLRADRARPPPSQRLHRLRGRPRAPWTGRGGAQSSVGARQASTASARQRTAIEIVCRHHENERCLGDPGLRGRRETMAVLTNSAFWPTASAAPFRGRLGVWR
jgi:hypothetical protein